MQRFTFIIILFSLRAGFQASPTYDPLMDIENCLICFSPFVKCSAEYMEEFNCLPKKTKVNVRKSSSADSEVHCHIGNHTRVKTIKCYFGFSLVKVDCNKPIPVNSTVEYTCPTFYQPASTFTSWCQNDSTWSQPIRCIPECGRTFTEKPLTPLILSGREVQSRSQWPWAASLYLIKDNQTHYNYICGATLVSDDLLVSAAQCPDSNSTNSSNLLVVFHKYMRKISREKADVHGYKVKRTYRLPVFKALTNGFNSDISIMVLESPVKLSREVFPACLPSNNLTITPFTQAIVAGWGYPNVREERFSNNLLYIKVPLVDTVYCSKRLPEYYLNNLAFTTFCAGYTNGTGICKGDTGSGLLTMNPEGLWELQGVASAPPLATDQNTQKLLPCHPLMYSLYNKVYLFLEWIEKIVKFEESGGPKKKNIKVA